MKILIIGFQRSGTTLLRRLVTMHPSVKTILHEDFLLSTYKSRPELLGYLESKKFNHKKDNWGDKTPYYPNIRKIPPAKYCNQWIDNFGKKESKILNIYRHPYDIAFSVENKYRQQTFNKAINIYNKSILKTLRETMEIPNVMSFKYEDLILNHDVLLPKIYEFCGLKKDIKYLKLMSQWENSKYQSFDKTRVFAYKKKKVPKINHDLRNIIKELNEKLDGPEYSL